MLPVIFNEICLRETIFAKIAQLVEHDLAKVGVAGSSPVFRSLSFYCERLGTRSLFRFSLQGCPNGGIGRHAGLKILWPLWPCGFKSHFGYKKPRKFYTYGAFLL